MGQWVIPLELLESGWFRWAFAPTLAVCRWVMGLVTLVVGSARVTDRTTTPLAVFAKALPRETLLSQLRPSWTKQLYNSVKERNLWAAFLTIITIQNPAVQNG
jgi:hypothetical protein